MNEICGKRGTGEKERSRRMTIRYRWERKRNRAEIDTEGKERKKYTCERGRDKRDKKMKRERK